MGVAENQECEHSLEQLLDEVRPRLRSVLASYRIPFEDAEDLLQQSILTLLIKRESIRQPDRWLVGTLRNHCRMYWRNHRSRLYESMDAALLEAIAAPRAPEQERLDLARDLNDALGELPARCRSVLHLRYGLGCEPREIARRLGYRRSGIYKILERSLARLARKMVAVGFHETRETPPPRRQPPPKKKRPAPTSALPRASASRRS